MTHSLVNKFEADFLDDAYCGDGRIAKTLSDASVERARRDVSNVSVLVVCAPF